MGPPSTIFPNRHCYTEYNLEFGPNGRVQAPDANLANMLNNNWKHILALRQAGRMEVLTPYPVPVAAS